jgi:hypothetical protein
MRARVQMSRVDREEERERERTVRTGAMASAGPTRAEAAGEVDRLLALQRMVGNRAVVSSLLTGSAAPPTVQRKASFNKVKQKWVSDMPALLNQSFASKKAAEDAEEAAKRVVVEEPKAFVTIDDGTGGDFGVVKSKDELRQEAREGVDADALQAEVNTFTGKVSLIGLKFNQLVNALEAQSNLEMGDIVAKYPDSGSKWSVAVTLPFLSRWEIHAHCEEDGTTARGDNPMHFKRRSERYSKGVSVALTARQEVLLIPEPKDRKRAEFTR